MVWSLPCRPAPRGHPSSLVQQSCFESTAALHHGLLSAPSWRTVIGVPDNYDATPWRTSAGTTVFAPFKEDTSYFGDRRLQWMINFRVRDLNKMVAQLREKGIAVEVDAEVYPNGRFARLSDPEGNPIQLWQPGGKDPG